MNILLGQRSRSALTSRSFVLGAFAVNNSYDANLAVGVMPMPPADAAALVMSRDIATMRAKIAELVKYESDVRAYYDNRVNRTSGGKRDRMRAERKDLTYAAAESLGVLRSGLATAEREYTAAVVSIQPDYNPDTGVPLTPEEKTVRAAAASSDMSKYLIPIGAGLAALFFLKGH